MADNPQYLVNDGVNNSFQQQQQQQDEQQQQRSKHPMANYQFSPEELRVLKNCNRDSFFQRSLPFGTGLGVAAYFAVKNGYLKPSARYGATPKVLLGVLLGYFIGKFSYRKKCMEKIMQLPNSKLGELLKQRKRGGFYESLTPDQGLGAGFALAPFSSASDHYSDEALKTKQGSSLDIDVERPTASGLDDNHRPNVDNSNTVTFEDDLPLGPPKQTVTYDELRQRNRDEYAKKTQSPYYKPIPQDTPPIVRSNEQQQPSTSSRFDEAQQQSPKGSKNKYGDTWTQ